MWFRIRPHFNVCISIITGKASPVYCIYLPGIHTTPGHLVTTWFCNKFNVIAWFLNLIKFRLVIRSCTNSIVNIIVRVMVLYMHLDIFFGSLHQYKIHVSKIMFALREKTAYMYQWLPCCMEASFYNKSFGTGWNPFPSMCSTWFKFPKNKI